MMHLIFSAARTIPLLLIFMSASCISLSPTPQRGDPELLELSEAAHLAYARGDIPRAAVLYRQALDRARVIDEPGEIVDAARDLAICEIAQKHWKAADALLQEARYDAGRGSLDGSEIVLLRAKVAYLEGRVSDSENLADEISAGGINPAVRLQALILKGQALCDTGNLAAAKAQLRAVDNASASGGAMTPSIQAEASKLRGTIARLENKPGDAAALFDREANLLRLSRRYANMPAALARAGECYLAAGKPKLAADRFYLAGRSLAAQGDSAAAKPMLASSISSAEKANDPAARSRAEALLREINQSGGPGEDTSPPRPPP